MVDADALARYLPYWQCLDCGVRVFASTIDSKRQACSCGVGEGRWVARNQHLLDWAWEQVGTG